MKHTAALRYPRGVRTIFWSDRRNGFYTPHFAIITKGFYLLNYEWSLNFILWSLYLLSRSEFGDYYLWEEIKLIPKSCLFWKCVEPFPCLAATLFLCNHHVSHMMTCLTAITAFTVVGYLTRAVYSRIWFKCLFLRGLVVTKFFSVSFSGRRNKKILRVLLTVQAHEGLLART